MNTPTHILLGAFAFGRRERGTMLAAGLGGLLPDLPAFALVTWAGSVQRIDARTIFRDLYFSDPWQAVIGPSHSVFVWGAILARAWWLSARAVQALSLSGLLHLAMDFPVHHSDPHRHLWPFSD